ncbi:uncharacterized protein METZ01_LOCUS94736 [marine metagenome]|uniref:Uncharacterized protein n=1 Tax=marine metagenome TaxID=408172 RepID=A0A381VNN0_9ZZZZ
MLPTLGQQPLDIDPNCTFNLQLVPSLSPMGGWTIVRTGLN